MLACTGYAQIVPSTIGKADDKFPVFPDNIDDIFDPYEKDETGNYKRDESGNRIIKRHFVNVGLNPDAPERLRLWIRGKHNEEVKIEIAGVVGQRWQNYHGEFETGV